MSREIKFRAWTDSWGMVYFNTGGFTIDVQSKTVWKDTMDEECVELQQYTGLTDSTGKEIYEGDIVSFEYRNEGLFSGLIAFDDMYLGFSLQKTKAFYGNIQLTFSSSRDLKIIGNIFETPELLA